jgi:nickel/cobalt exporter
MVGSQPELIGRASVGMVMRAQLLMAKYVGDGYARTVRAYDPDVTANGPALLAAAAGVGFGHAILPDHWVPLAVLGRTRRYPLARVARLSAIAGIAHVLVSVALGGVIIAVGLQFRSEVQSAQDAIVGGLLIATGVIFALLELTGRGHKHPHHHDQAHEHPTASGIRGLTAVMVPFGAAASPDLTILPVFLAAAAVGVATAVVSLLIFAAVTIGTIVGLTLAATRGGYQIRGEWLERRGNALTALVLIVIGALVLAGLI